MSDNQVHWLELHVSALGIGHHRPKHVVEPIVVDYHSMTIQLCCD